MWNAAHLDRRQHRLANGSVAQKTFRRADRLVEAHVLVDGQRNAGVIAELYGFASFAIVYAERLLSENPFTVPRAHAASINPNWAFGGTAMSSTSIDSLLSSSS